MKYVRNIIIVSVLLVTLSSRGFTQRSLYLNEQPTTGGSGVANPQGYFEKWDYFGPEVTKTDALIAQSLRPFDKQEPKPEKKTSSKPIEQVSPKKPNPLKMDKEEFNRYLGELAGDASETPFIEPNADAPPAFKAMHACLQRGDYDCANKYAEKYTKGNIAAEQYYAEIKKITENKLRKQGMLPESIESEEPDYENINVLESGSKNKKTETDDNSKSGGSVEGSEKPDDENGGGSVGQIPGSVGQLLREGEQREDQYINKNRDAIRPPTDDGLGGGDEVLRMLSIPEDKQRKQANDKYQGILPKDEKGAVRVYFFFRNDDLDAFAMLPVLERVYQAHKDDKKFILLAFSLSAMTNTELKAMKGKVKVNFPLRSGSVIAKQLGITSSPTTLVVAPSNGNYAKEEGIRGFGFVDELVRLVDGSGPTKRGSK